MLKLCTLASGSNGNCTYITDGESHILIDAGISARTITSELAALGLSPHELDAVLITHEHTDHIRGIETLAKKCCGLNFYATSTTASEIALKKPTLGDRFSSLSPGSTLNIRDIEVSFFYTPHDTPESVGYRINAGGKTLVIATDLGHVPEHILECIRGADILLVEANYDDNRLRYGCYPEFLKQRILSKTGHLSNTECASFVYQAVKSGTRHVMLGHLSEENNTPETAYTTVHTKLTENGIIPGVDMMLDVAPRGKRGNVLIFE